MAGLEGQRVVVMGLGRFGGGVGAVRWLASQGAEVVVTDLASASALAESLAQIEDLVGKGAVRLRLGEHNVSDFTGADVVVANPAVARPWENRFLRAARAAGVEVTTEIGLVVERLPARGRVVGVTGSAGKSTTSAMIAHVMERAGMRVRLGGNIGGSLLGVEIGADEWVVLELSSAQLHWIEGWSARVAVVTNVAPNHVDWHGSVEHYVASKQRLLAWQGRGDAALLGEGAEGWEVREGVERLSAAECEGMELRIPGAHNVANARAAVAVCAWLGVDEREAVRAIGTFGGLKHRLELVGECGGVRFFNDSKSTTAQSAAMAIGAFEAGRVRLICGGYDKKVEMGALAEAARGCACVRTIGATGEAIAGLVGAGAKNVGTLEAAFGEVAAGAREGDVVLLSPGCASWDQFENYESRGEAFRKLVRQWEERVVGASVA